MAIAFDATDAGSSSSTASLTFSHVCTGADRYLVVAVGIRDVGATLTGVTYNGVGMTQIGSTLATDSVEFRLYGLAGPASGTNNVVVSLDAAQRVAAVSASYTGVHQSVSLGTPVSEEDASIAVGSADGEYVVAGSGWQCADSTAPNCAWSVLSERNERRAGTAGNDPGVTIADTTGASSVTCAWTPTATTGSVKTIGVSLKPVATSGSIANKLYGLLGGNLVGKVC